MSDFWVEEISIEQVFKKFVQKNKKHTSIWDFLRESNPKDKSDYLEYPLAISDTFYGFNNDLGMMPYEEQEQEAYTKFKEYEKETSQLLRQQPNVNLLPESLDFEKVENEKEWEVYYTFMDTYPIAYKFEGYFTLWSNKEMMLFLSVSKEGKELPYEIHLGTIDLEYYQKVLNVYHTIKQDIESGVYADFADEEYEDENEEEYYEKYYSKLNIQQIIKEKVHDLTGKNRAIHKFVAQEGELPLTFDDGKLLIFHLLDSINYIVNPLQEGDKEYINLALQNGAKSQLNTEDSKTGMTPVLYAYARGLTPFAAFLQTKGADLQKELINPQGQQLLLAQLIYSTHYRSEKLIQNILPFIPNKLVKTKEQILWEKLAKGHIYGNAEIITRLFIDKGLHPETPLSNGTNVLASALLINDKKWIQALQPYLTIEKHINQTDNYGNSLVHLWNAFLYNNNLPNDGIAALKNIVSCTELSNNSLNHKKQTTLHLLATHEVDPYNDNEQKQAEIDALLQAFDLMDNKINNYNQQDAEGNTALHYFAGYHFLEKKKGILKPKRFNKTNEQKWRLPLVKKLIEKGAYITLKNNAKQSPKEVATLCKLDEIARIL